MKTDHYQRHGDVQVWMYPRPDGHVIIRLDANGIYHVEDGGEQLGLAYSLGRAMAIARERLDIHDAIKTLRE